MAALIAAPPAADAGSTLTLRRAGRAIDLAFAAELAGDYEGARRALEAQLEAARRPEEAAGRARLQSWLDAMAVRKAAFERAGKTPEAYLEALDSMEGFGASRADLLWHEAQRDIAALDREYRAQGRVRLRLERVVGLAREAPEARAHLEERLAGGGLTVTDEPEAAPYEVRLNVDARRTEDLQHRKQVTAEGSYVMRDRRPEPPRLVGTFMKRRTVVRGEEVAARAFAVRRLLDDAARSVVFQVRRDVLRRLAQP